MAKFEGDFEIIGAIAAAGAERADAAVETSVPDECQSTVATQTTPTDADMLGELQRDLCLLQERGEVRNSTQDKRVRVLESLVEPMGARVSEVDRAVTALALQIREQEAIGKEVARAIHGSLDETAAVTRDNSSRLDRMVVKYLPDIEKSVATAELAQRQKADALDAQVREIDGKIDEIRAVDVAEVRRLAINATLRSLLVESALPEFKAGILAMVLPGIVRIREEGKANAEAADQLAIGHREMCDDLSQVTGRLRIVDQVVRHLSGTVVPILEGRVQDQAAAIAEKDAELERVRRFSAERDVALFSRMAVLEIALMQTQKIAEENKQLKERISSLETAVERLALSKESDRCPPADRTPPAAVKARAITRPAVPMAMALCAELIRRELRAEINRRRERAAAPGSVVTPLRLRSEILRRALLGEIGRRRGRKVSRRGVIPAGLKSEILLRALHGEIRRRRRVASAPRPRISPRTLKSEILRRALAAEIEQRKQRCLTRVKSSFPAGTVHMKCTTVSGNITLDVALPHFVSVAYLKQLIYFKTDCSLHPTGLTLVHAGKILQDDLRIGGGVYTPPGSRASQPLESVARFNGIRDGSTVLMVFGKH